MGGHQNTTINKSLGDLERLKTLMDEANIDVMESARDLVLKVEPEGVIGFFVVL